ncbi:DNA-binding transcriptional LysR family regulator [Rhodoligotrophos appendicifer]|uniref:LysR substrate-binding domain-containing protein n=1 Tax=Rhodoligotrophos appendicifer TaxID=987056 RepID=UPI00117E835E|nr:LysR substrate-binding domain-containing protein [Rhodoligotrophos appendicifer]
MRRLPSLGALRGFEALARTLSFTRAAAELGVTQAAVSRQIRGLETELSVRLIDRRPGAVHHLTDAGRLLFEGLDKGFGAIAEAVAQVAGSEDRHILTVGVPPFFSAEWLTPRLHEFLSMHPDIELRLHHSYAPADHRREGMDLDISWAGADAFGIRREKVLDGSLVPVASPAFVETSGGIAAPRDLLEHRLFHEFEVDHWVAWFAGQGVKAPEKIPSLRLNDSHALLRTALDGHGVALFFAELIQPYVQSGQLMRLFPNAVHVGLDFQLGFPDGRDLTAKAKAFRRFVHAVAAGSTEEE